MTVGVFTGAGLSHDLPARLPLGWTMRDAVLRRCHEAAAGLASGAVTADRLQKLEQLPWKFEYVIGRLHGTTGDTAFDVLAAMALDIPNEAHLLAAVLLGRGGVHLTLNFDEGIEHAYAPLAGTAELPTSTQAVYRDALTDWRRVVGVLPPDLKVVASPGEFADWARKGSVGPVLFKLHGGIRSVAGVTVPHFPVVTDEVELAQLSPHQRRALALLADCDTVIVTGYSGEDIDCYEPLLATIADTDVVWAEPGTFRPAVREALAAMAGARPELATAVEILRRQGLAALPGWPQVVTGEPPWIAAFERWASAIDDRDAAEAYAWMLIDAGELSEAVAILRQVLDRQPVPHQRTLIRLADAYYDLGHTHRRDARRLYRQVTRQARPTGGLATYAWTRWGDCHRSSGGLRNRIATVLGPVVALLGARRDHAPHQVRARTLNSLAHTLLRTMERLSPRALSSGRGRSLVARCGAVVNAIQRRALLHLDTMEVPAGNRRILIEYQVVEVDALAALLGEHGIDRSAMETVVRVRTSYARMPDRRGVANTHAAAALARAAQGRWPDADAELDLALAFYRRPGGEVDDSGRRLVESRRALIQAARTQMR